MLVSWKSGIRKELKIGRKTRNASVIERVGNLNSILNKSKNITLLQKISLMRLRKKWRMVSSNLNRL